jgi:hypothetical protein
MDKRAAFRFPTDVEAECRSCDRSWASRMCNISTTGCMIVCHESDLPRGALLRLRIKGLTAIDGEIIWQHRNHAGVRFRVPLHNSVIEHLAFKGTDRGYDPPPVAVPPPAASQPRSAPTALHGQLVKRTWIGPEDSEPRYAQAG